MRTLIAVSLITLSLAACTDATQAPPADLATSGNPDLSEPQGPPPDLGCYGNPMTHVEIINACTTAQSYDKMPQFPSLAPNGVLPPLQ